MASGADDYWYDDCKKQSKEEVKYLIDNAKIYTTNELMEKGIDELEKFEKTVKCDEFNLKEYIKSLHRELNEVIKQG